MLGAMEFDLDQEHRPHAYQILSALVTPRPIAWVTTLSVDGKLNAAPFSFFNVFGSKPPIVGFSPGDKTPHIPKDTAKNIRETGEFVVNMVDLSVSEAMVASAATLPHGESELEGLNVSTVGSSVVAPPRITEAPVSLECKKHSILEIGQNRLVIGTVHRVHVKDGLFDEDTLRFNQELYAPLGRMASPDWYCLSESLLDLPRPK